MQGLNKTGLNQIVVQLRAGTYFLPTTESFTAADSGTVSMPIIYENYPGETPVISGGVRVVNWTNASGNIWTTTLPASTQYFENLFYNGGRRLRPRVSGPLGGTPYLRVFSTVYLAASQTNCPVQDTTKLPGNSWECFDRFQYATGDPIASAWKNLAHPPIRSIPIATRPTAAKRRRRHRIADLRTVQHVQAAHQLRGHREPDRLSDGTDGIFAN